MSTTTRRDKTAAEKLANDHPHIPRRTVRAVRESMAVDAYTHGTGIGLFDVYSGSGRRYTVDLWRAAREERTCDCPDAQHNLASDEACKHEIRVKMMLGIEEVPLELSDHVDGTLRINMEKFGATVSIKSGLRVAADGGESEREEEEMSYLRRDELSAADRARLTCHQVASGQTSTASELPDFDVFCVCVGVVSDHLVREVNRERQREAERQTALREIAHEHELEQRADQARSRGRW